MLVSVIIPAYNSEGTISNAINSVIEQNYQNIEIIVIDDGSSDNTKHIVSEFKGVKYYYQNNAGVSFARNLGFSKANGDYIQYLDSDDLLAKNKISNQVEALVKSNADVAYGDWQKIMINTQSELNYLDEIHQVLSNRPEVEIFKGFWCPLSAILYSRKICEKISSWNVNLPIIQDARYFLDAALLGAKFIYTPGIMGYYLVNESGSLSSSSKLNFINDCFLNAKEIHSKWKTDLEFDLDKKNALIEVLRFCINMYSRLDKVKFNQCIDLLLSIEPDYVPEKSIAMNKLSKMFGYRFAENIASVKRKFL